MKVTKVMKVIPNVGVQIYLWRWILLHQMWTETPGKLT